MVKIARPCRQINVFDTVDVCFTACSILDGELVLWGQLIDIDDPDGTLYTNMEAKIASQIKSFPPLCPREIYPGEAYLIQYNLDKRWYRAKVMNVISSECHVLLKNCLVI